MFDDAIRFLDRRFTKYTLMDGLYWEYWYDDLNQPTNAEDRNILYENRLLGLPRIRQVKSLPHLREGKAKERKNMKGMRKGRGIGKRKQISSFLASLPVCVASRNTAVFNRETQLRVSNESCQVNEILGPFPCYAPYSPVLEDRRGFGSGDSSV